MLGALSPMRGSASTRVERLEKPETTTSRHVVDAVDSVLRPRGHEIRKGDKWFCPLDFSTHRSKVRSVSVSSSVKTSVKTSVKKAGFLGSHVGVDSVRGALHPTKTDVSNPPLHVNRGIRPF